ncbi:hypothetical protein [Streptomyces sp. NPDC054952]
MARRALCRTAGTSDQRAREALTLHRPEQYIAFDRRSNPAIHRAPHTVHSVTPAPSLTTASRLRNLCWRRHDLERQADEQNTAFGEERNDQ